jgi:hypothetical protein
MTMKYSRRSYVKTIGKGGVVIAAYPHLGTLPGKDKKQSLTFDSSLQPDK